MAETATAPAPQPPKPYVMPAQRQAVNEGPSLRPRMKRDDITAHVLSGAVFLVGEYRGTKIDVVNYSDKTTGKPAHFVKVEHAVEMTNPDGQTETLTVEERQPREIDKATDVHVGLRKGETVAFRLLAIGREKGRLKASIDGLSGAVVLE